MPNPREVSRIVFASQLGPKNQFDKSRSAELMGHGQLIAHDIIRTEINEGKTGDVMKQAIKKNSGLKC